MTSVAFLPNMVRVSRHLNPTIPDAGLSRTSTFSMALMVCVAFSMLVIVFHTDLRIRVDDDFDFGFHGHFPLEEARPDTGAA